MFASKNLADSSAFASPADGLRTALPVVFAYIPLGFAAGVVGVRAGLTPAEVALLSLLVFAGISQFIFAELVSGSPVALVSTVFLVNFRHFLYSTALAQKIKHVPAPARVAVGAQLTDEGFALMSLLYRRQHGVGGLLTLNMSCYLAWLSGNIAGAVTGNTFNMDKWGADYLLIAMFAALLMLKMAAARRKTAAVLVLCLSAALSVGLEKFQPHPFNILLAAGLAAAVAAALFRQQGDDALADAETPS